MTRTIAGVCALVAVARVAVAADGAATTLTLADYLGQVRAGAPGLRAAEDAATALPLMAEEAGLVYSPLLRATGTRTDNRAEGSSALQPERTVAGIWNVGLSKKFWTGTTLALDYGLNYTRIFPAPIPGLPPSLAAGFFPAAPFYDARPTVSVTQSLLRDVAGGMTGAAVRKAEAQAAAGAAASRYRVKATLFQAEQAYWTASLARDVLGYARASMERTGRLVEWTRKKVDLNLAEEADLLQVQAGGKLRELALKAAEQDLAAAERTLDTFRGRAGGAVPEELEHINARLDAGLAAAPALSGTRLDVQAANLALAGAEAGARETAFRALPDLNAFGTVTWNGHDTSSGAASGEAFDGDHPTYTVGAAFTAPLDVFRLRRVRRGYDVSVRAARREADRARLEAAQDWDQLQARWTDVAARLALTKDIESLQQQKYQAENQRFSEGRTTTFQLLAAEEDLGAAQVTRLRIGLERLLLEAQARLARGD